VEGGIKDFLEKVVIPPAMVSSICGGEVNDAYLEYVVMLNSRLHYATGSESFTKGTLGLAPTDTVAAHELLPDLERLRLRAVAKAREYMLLKIGELRKPKTNVQMIQKTGLLKYHHLMTFLMESSPEVAMEIRTVYMDSMSRTLQTLFKHYYAALTKLDLEIANKHDLIAVEEGASKVGFMGSKVNLSKRGDAFTLGDRADILGKVDEEPVLVHVAHAEDAAFAYEAIFRSVMKHLMDAATNEYLFGIDFFGDRSFDTFNQIFSRTISLILENLENYLFGCFDALGLLLMIKLVHAMRLSMQRRRVPVLDSVFDRVNMLLWPRLKVCLDANLRSVEQASPRKLGGVQGPNPHYVTRRYAEFTASVLLLHALGMESLGIAGGGEDMLLNDLTKLRVGVLTLLRRLSDELPSSKQKVVFLINNFDQVLSVFGERQIIGDESARFEELLAQHRGLFVEEELLESFSSFITFVQHTEAYMGERQEEGGSMDVDTAAVEALVRDFAASWKSGIEAIYQNVLEYFSNFRNGMEILKQVLTQLLLYYTRFQDIIRKVWGRRQPPFAKDIVSTATILVEIKKYSRAI